ncbi:MAG: Fur family transcriptional regulator [Anaerolineales bacterium]
MDRSKVAQTIRRHGIRVTAQRVGILQVLSNAKGHPSAQEIHEQAAEALPGLNVATVYRALYQMQEAGLVDLFSTVTGVQRFGYRDPDNPHAHLVCDRCGVVFELSPQVFSPLAQTLMDESGFKLDARHVVLSGRCQSCRSAQKVDRDD